MGFIKLARIKILRYGNWRDLVIPSDDLRRSPDQLGTDLPFNLAAIVKDYPEIANKRDRFLFVTAIAASAGEVYGPNDNGDYFPEEVLKEAYTTFVRRGVYVDHNSENVDNAIGVILASHWDDVKKQIIILKAISRDEAPEIVRKIENGLITDVSMGCYVEEAECSKCSKIIYSDNEICECLDELRNGCYRKGGHYEINRGVTFIECSAISDTNEGADSEAKYLERLAKKAARLNIIKGRTDMRHRVAQEAPPPPPVEEPVKVVEMLLSGDGKRNIWLEGKDITLEVVVTALVQRKWLPEGFTVEDITGPEVLDIIAQFEDNVRVVVPMNIGAVMTASPPESEESEESPPEEVDTLPEIKTEQQKRTAVPVPPMIPQPKIPSNVIETEEEDDPLDYVVNEVGKGRPYEEVIEEAQMRFKAQSTAPPKPSGGPGNAHTTKNKQDEDSWGTNYPSKPKKKAQEMVSPDTAPSPGNKAKPLAPVDEEGANDIAVDILDIVPGQEIQLTGIPAVVEEVTAEGDVIVTIEGLEDQAVIASPEQVIPIEEVGTGDGDYEDDETLGGTPPEVMTSGAQKRRRFKRAQEKEEEDLVTEEGETSSVEEEILEDVEEAIEESVEQGALSEDMRKVHFLHELVNIVLRGETVNFSELVSGISSQLGFDTEPTRTELESIADIYLPRLYNVTEPEGQKTNEEEIDMTTEAKRLGRHRWKPARAKPPKRSASKFRKGERVKTAQGWGKVIGVKGDKVRVDLDSDHFKIGSQVKTAQGWGTIRKIGKDKAGDSAVLVDLDRDKLKVGSVVITPQGKRGRIVKLLSKGKVVVDIFKSSQEVNLDKSLNEGVGPSYDQNEPKVSPLAESSSPMEDFIEESSEAVTTPDYPADNADPPDTGPADVSKQTLEAYREKDLTILRQGNELRKLTAQLAKQGRQEHTDRVISIIDRLVRTGSIDADDAETQDIEAKKLMSATSEHLDTIELILDSAELGLSELEEPISRTAVATSLRGLPRSKRKASVISDDNKLLREGLRMDI